MKFRQKNKKGEEYFCQITWIFDKTPPCIFKYMHIGYTHIYPQDL